MVTERKKMKNKLINKYGFSKDQAIEIIKHYELYERAGLAINIHEFVKPILKFNQSIGFEYKESERYRLLRNQSKVKTFINRMFWLLGSLLKQN